MKGATVGGAVPAILFNTPGTPDAFMTTLDGHPMTKARPIRQGAAGRACLFGLGRHVLGHRPVPLRALSGDPGGALSGPAGKDRAPDPVAGVHRRRHGPVRGQGADRAWGWGFWWRWSGPARISIPGSALAPRFSPHGFPIVTVILGVLILGEVFKTLEEIWSERLSAGRRAEAQAAGDQHLSWRELRGLLPFISRSAVIGTGIGALPGIGSTLAATLGYTDRARGASAPEPRWAAIRRWRARRRRRDRGRQQLGLRRQPDPGPEPRHPRQRRRRVHDPRRRVDRRASTRARRSFASRQMW